MSTRHKMTDEIDANNPAGDSPALLPSVPVKSAGGKRRVERLRRPVSFAFAVALFGLVLAIRPSGFGGTFHTIVKLGGYFMVFVACIGRIWCSIHIAGRKNRELCQTGPYALTRNPLYFFSFMGAVGVLLGAQACLEATLMALAFVTYYEFMIRTEERRLTMLFGSRFEAYCRTVPRFWPRWRKLPQVRMLEIDVNVLTKAVLDASLFLFAILGIEVLGKLKADHADWFIQVPW